MTVKRILALPALAIWHALFWTFERATWQYDLMVIAILAFVWDHATQLAGRSDGSGTRTDWVGDRNT